jgi:hypothetical protein
MKSHIFIGESVEEITAEIRNATAGGLLPTLGIIFASPRLPIEELSGVLAEHQTGFIGCTTDGEIVSLGDERAAYEGTAAVCLIEMDPGFFRVAFFRGAGKTSFDKGVELGTWGKKVFANPAFMLLSGGLHADGEQILRGLLSVTGEATPVYGGLAGDERMFKRTLVFTNGECTDDGISAVVFDGDKIELGGIATSGWIGIGAEKKVTKASGNIVYAIDNRPALQVYKQYLDVEDHELPQIGVDYPLMLLRNDGSSVLRGVMDVDKTEGSLTFAGTVPEGAKVRFSSASGSDVIEHAKRDLDAYQKTFPKADLLILFSCMARHLSLGPMVDEEIVAAQRKWNAPLVGLFTYGEIGRNVNGRSDFFNETFMLAALRIR